MAMAAAAMPFATMAAFGQSKLETVRLSMGSTNDPAYLPFFVAIDKGYYRQLGLDVQPLFVGGGVAIPALLAGSLEFTSSTGSAITAALKGGALKIVMNLSERVPWKLWATRPEITALADMKGKSVGIQTRGDLFDMSMRTVLMDAGMDPDAVRYMALGFGSAARIAAIQKGLLDAVVLTNLEERILRERGELSGAHILVDISHTIRVPNNGLAVSDALLAKNPALVERMVRGTLMAMRYIEVQRKGALKIYAAHAPALSPAVLRGSLDETAGTFLDDGMASLAARQSEIAVRSSIVDLPAARRPSPDKIFDYALVRQAARALQADHWTPAE
jgi:NitT/TauT family transport system substrate-binding protein